MDYVGLTIFIIGAIIGGVIENFVLGIGDLILEQFDCEGIKNENWEKACNNNKWSYFIGSKILFPIAGGIGLYVGIKNRLKK